MRSRIIHRALLTAVLAVVSATAFAADWPQKSVRVIVVYPPGGVSDSVTRAISDKLSERLGESFVVENKGGAGGTVGMNEVARAPADGYTIGFSSVSPLVLSPAIREVPYDPQKDIAPIGSVMVSPVILLGTKAFSGKSIADVISQSQAEPGALRWSTSGQGSLGHLMLEQLQQVGKIEVTHIPYKGAGQQLTDALGGQFELISTNMSPAIKSNLANGTFVPLAIAAPARVESLPDVPTFSELGYAEANKMSVFGFFAPGKTPEAIVAKLNKEINQVVATPEIQKLLIDSNNIPATSTPQEFADNIEQELASNRALVEKVGLK
ncbi:Bug family tripartite tricarboxylate transporter substrate binding protein [Pollutimonas harenae]|uniref:Tripartite tricarboxylate transporter substrate binding protein n=1 Tax=Pollutimonas harenae TaxID=657015 RepID=A0A853H1P6_9BURK|nr:tripartite tricarboxylate transporter substrate binding protein [Pollutimonas harenae]NYT85155.1 tripartite tricarboxylate transporter substrate binding protein [Pollutimonas harenae]TEA72465.1 tripartite tricarboxylate transporter substrate binding protein [Pollutimonas harenae]